MCPTSDLRRLIGRLADLRKHISATDPEQVGHRRAIGRAIEGEVDGPSSLVLAGRHQVAVHRQRKPGIGALSASMSVIRSFPTGIG